MVVSWQQELGAARGVRRWDAAVPVSELEQEVERQGLQCVQLDGTDVEDKVGFLRLCEDAFELPDWFGHNWDALEESLVDVGPGEDGAGTVVIWSDSALFAENEPDEYATALDVFNDTARTLGVDGVRFVVLLVGEGTDDEDDEPVLDVVADEDIEVDLDLPDDDGEPVGDEVS